LTKDQIYWNKIAKSRFVLPFWGLTGNVHGSSRVNAGYMGTLQKNKYNELFPTKTAKVYS